MDYNPKQRHPVQMKARLDNNEQRPAASADVWTWSVIVRPSEWHGSLTQLPRQFRTGLWAAGQRDLCRRASMAESTEFLEVRIRGKA
jgi:hypothetical protein